MTQQGTPDDDWEKRKNVNNTCLACGNDIDKEKLREATRKRKKKLKDNGKII